MQPKQPSSDEGDVLFRAMENMLRLYATGRAGPVTAQPPGQGAATRNDAMAAAYQVAMFIAATKHGDAVPDPGAAAAHLMVMMEYVAPQPDDLDPQFKDALQVFIRGLRELEA